MKKIDKCMKEELAKNIAEDVLSNITDCSDPTKITYKNIAMLDLRHITDPEAVAQIGEIKNVAILLLPTPNTPELQLAWTRVSMKNIAKTLYLKEGDTLIMRNGKIDFDLSGKGNENDTVYLLNGEGVIFGTPDIDKQIKIIANGLFIVDAKIERAHNVQIDFNGVGVTIDFEKYKIIMDNIITKAHLSNIEKNTLLICECRSKIKIDKSVEESDLSEKNVKFVFKGRVYKCSKKLRGYMSINSAAVDC